MSIYDKWAKKGRVPPKWVCLKCGMEQTCVAKSGYISLPGKPRQKFMKRHNQTKCECLFEYQVGRDKTEIELRSSVG